MLPGGMRSLACSVFVVGAVLVGCSGGDSGSSDNPGASGSSGTGGSSGSGGSAGSGASAGSGGASGSSGSAGGVAPVCVPHANGANASPKSGTSKVSSAVTFGGQTVNAVGAVDADTYVVAEPGTKPTYGGLAYTAPMGPHKIVAKVKDKADWAWVLDGATNGTTLKAWKGGVVVLVQSQGGLKVSTTAGVAGPAVDPAVKLGLLFLDTTGAAAKATFAALPTLSGQAMFEVTREGAVFVGGQWPTGATFGGIATSCGESPAIARWDAVGQKALWARCVGKPGSAITLEALTADGTGKATLSGFPGMNPDFDLGPTAVDASAGGSYVVTLDSAGKTTSVDYTLRAYAQPIATEDGTRFFIGDAPQPDAKNGLIQYFGAQWLPCGSDGFKTIVSRMNPDGKIAWVRIFGGSQRMAVLPDKRVVLADSGVSGPVADGLTFADANRPYVLVLDDAGNVASVQTLGDAAAMPNSFSLFPVATTANGIWLGGNFNGTLNFKTPLTATGLSDLLISLTP